MSRDFNEYMAAAAQAYHDSRRNAVESAIGTLQRTPVTQAIDAYVDKLIRNRERKHGANPSGRNSWSANVKLVLLKVMRELGITYLDELTAGKVATYLDAYKGSAKTVRAHKSVLDGLITFARQKEWLSSDPLEILDTPDLPPGKIQYVKLEDFPQVLETMEGESAELPVGLAGLGGVRRCEAIRLDPKDYLRSGERHIRIRAEVAKTNRERFVPVSPQLEEIIERCGERFGPALCRSERKAKWEGQNVLKMAKQALMDSGIKTAPEGVPLVKAGIFNTLRHSAITFWLDAGKDPWKVASWSGNSVLVIEKHYGHHIVRPEDADEATFKARQAK